ncbi:MULTISPECIES: hypothetical protein [Bacillaceae]|uniref:Uncharacterized protein n=1 Tax=Evansella alkalicola TaxID=745819 RepID=A0ABS6K1M2_9BACI|nr:MULTISPECIES: hypothetical protein [Bacillaceae]MBU9723270.1 hypothetical protein [Bacillus alkalicola]
MNSIQLKRRFIETTQDPVLDYVVKLPNGEIGEAATPFYLCDLIFHNDYTDCEDPATWFMLIMDYLRNMALSSSMDQQRVTVYDAKGIFYDGLLSNQNSLESGSEDLNFINRDNPIILDGYDPYTAIASLIKHGYIQLWEKYPIFSEERKVSGCNNCSFNMELEGTLFCKAWDYKNAQWEWEKPCFWLTNGEKMKEYHFVDPKNIKIDMSHRDAYKPVNERLDHRFSNKIIVFQDREN